MYRPFILVRLREIELYRVIDYYFIHVRMVSSCSGNKLHAVIIPLVSNATMVRMHILSFPKKPTKMDMNDVKTKCDGDDSPDIMLKATNSDETSSAGNNSANGRYSSATSYNYEKSNDDVYYQLNKFGKELDTSLEGLEKFLGIDALLESDDDDDSEIEGVSGASGEDDIMFEELQTCGSNQSLTPFTAVDTKNYAYGINEARSPTPTLANKQPAKENNSACDDNLPGTDEEDPLGADVYHEGNNKPSSSKNCLHNHSPQDESTSTNVTSKVMNKPKMIVMGNGKTSKPKRKPKKKKGRTVDRLPVSDGCVDSDEKDICGPAEDDQDKPTEDEGETTSPLDNGVPLTNAVEVVVKKPTMIVMGNGRKRSPSRKKRSHQSRKQQQKNEECKSDSSGENNVQEQSAKSTSNHIKSLSLRKREQTNSSEKKSYSTSNEHESNSSQTHTTADSSTSIEEDTLAESKKNDTTKQHVNQSKNSKSLESGMRVKDKRTQKNRQKSNTNDAVSTTSRMRYQLSSRQKQQIQASLDRAKRNVLLG